MAATMPIRYESEKSSALISQRCVGAEGPSHAFTTTLIGRHAPERVEIEAFIQAVYRRAYQAEISVDYPRVMSIRERNGRIVAAAGIRLAGDEPLFLENYTREPAESALAKACGRAIPRSQIAEIGNLASAGGGVSLLLFAELTSWLEEHGITHLMVTVTEELHRRLLKLGLHPDRICDAAADLIGGASQNWGTYYRTKPRVLAGPVAGASRRLNTILSEECTRRQRIAAVARRDPGDVAP